MHVFMLLQGDQYLGLFGILGQLISHRARGIVASNEWTDFVINDLTQLCMHLLPRARAHLKGRIFAILSNATKDDEDEDTTTTAAASSTPYAPAAPITYDSLPKTTGDLVYDFLAHPW